MQSNAVLAVLVALLAALVLLVDASPVAQNGCGPPRGYPGYYPGGNFPGNYPGNYPGYYPGRFPGVYPVYNGFPPGATGARIVISRRQF